MFVNLSVRRDGGWAWFVLLAAFGNLFIAALPFCIGVYVNAILTTLNIDHATGGLFGALQLACLYLGGPATALSEMFSYRSVMLASGIVASLSIVASIHINNIYILFFTFATLPGLCIGISFIQSIIVINRYFDKYAGFANAAALSGCGLGSIVVPYVYEHIIEVYTWRQSLYIVAGLVLQTCVFAMVMRHIDLPVTDDATMSQQKIAVSNERMKLFKDPRFYVFIITNAFWSASMAAVFILGANLFHERGMSHTESGTLLAIVGFGNLGIRIVIAFLFHIRRCNYVLLFASITVMMGISIALFIVNDSFASYAIACFLFGMCYGATTVLQAMVPRDITSMYNYGTAYSFAIGFCVIGISGGPPLTGFIHDKTHGYVVPFLLNTGLAFMAAAILSITFCLSPRTKQKESTLCIQAKTPLVNSKVSEEYCLCEHETLYERNC